jgi:hypothetical protein
MVRRKNSSKIQLFSCKNTTLPLFLPGKFLSYHGDGHEEDMPPRLFSQAISSEMKNGK